MRALYVRCCFDRRSTFAGSCVLACSKLLGMTVAMAGRAISALGVPIELVRDRADFNQRLREIAQEPNRLGRH